MNENVKKLLIDIEDQLQFINAEFEDKIKRSEESAKIVMKAYEQLKQIVIKHKFKNQSEEIHYFKNLKPKLISKYIYFTKVYNIETKKPQGSDKIKKKYYLNELDKINRYFEANIDFIRYYRSNDNYLDHKYFVRNKLDFRFSTESFAVELDAKQSTNFDFKIAKILANDLLQVCLHEEIKYIEYYDRKEKNQVNPKIKLTWTDSKTALIELIYALHSQDVFDKGKADIKEIATYFENVFNVDLGDYYRTYLEIRVRRAGKTKFLDTLTQTLSKRMDDIDER